MKREINYNNNQWVTGFFDCFSYREADGACLYVPFFIPMAVCGTCCIIGRIQSILDDEPVTCCEMGTKGLALCLISAPINFLGPLGGFCWFALNSFRLRTEVIERHNIIDNTQICCFDQPVCLTAILYPCSYFQIYATLREHRRNYGSQSDGLKAKMLQ